MTLDVFSIINEVMILCACLSQSLYPLGFLLLIYSFKYKMNSYTFIYIHTEYEINIPIQDSWTETLDKGWKDRNGFPLPEEMDGILGRNCSLRG